MSDKNIIIGCGTGRCGTVSLSALFDKQDDSTFTHELQTNKLTSTDVSVILPWEVDEVALEKSMDSILSYKGSFVGDVSMFWLPYLKGLLEKYSNLKVIALKRDKTQVVDSYLKKTLKRNHWMNHDGKEWNYCPWDKSYPKFDVETKEEALNCYWDHYYSEIDKLTEEYPDRVRTYDMMDLNNDEKVAEILDFTGYENGQVLSSIKKNTTPKNFFDRILQRVFFIRF